MNQLGMASDKPYKKSARIVGEVIGKYHPHGDTSVYDAMVRMSQWWKSGAVLIDMHGNNGSMDGDSAAAMRYTEARLSPFAEAILQDIEKKTVNLVPNFDDEEYEPVVLPAKFPNLLVNGAMGMATGYATNILPHNFNEVIDAVALQDRPSGRGRRRPDAVHQGSRFPDRRDRRGHRPRSRRRSRPAAAGS
ncbi:MAG: hypothetical protein MZU97_11855 [Bacillus subtilis]|nr:hypothetical protein [Bacillus subtilis]